MFKPMAIRYGYLWCLLSSGVSGSLLGGATPSVLSCEKGTSLSVARDVADGHLWCPLHLGFAVFNRA